MIVFIQSSLGPKKNLFAFEDKSLATLLYHALQGHPFSGSFSRVSRYSGNAYRCACTNEHQNTVYMTDMRAHFVICITEMSGRASPAIHPEILNLLQSIWM